MSEQPPAAVPPAYPPAPQPPAGYPPVPPPPAAGPPYNPAAVWAVPPTLVPKVRRPRPWLRTALRWSIAAVVCVAVAAGTALAVSAPRRTDIPGLKTPADSRYVFPALVLPPLPPKALTPARGQTVTGHQDHAADLRKLLLPAPLGAKTDARFLPDATGWYPVGQYAQTFSDATSLTGMLGEYSVRHIAARAWTGADGVRTQIYLLGFRSDSDASFVYVSDLSATRPSSAPLLAADSSQTFPGLQDQTQATGLVQPSTAFGRAAVRMAFVNVGDVEAVIVMTGAKEVPLLNFRQVVSLQGELLQG